MDEKIRNITIFTGNRAEYGLLHPVIRRLSADDEFIVRLIVSGSHLLEHFGSTAVDIDTRGIRETRPIQIGCGSEGSINVHANIAAIVEKCRTLLDEIDTDIVLLAGDRHETFATAIAAFYKTIPIAHLFGGDLSQGGHLDDSVRHAITKLSHLHFVTNTESHQRVLQLGEEPWRVHNVGSPAVDSIIQSDYAPPQEVYRQLDIKAGIPILLFTQHPVTTDTNDAYQQAKASLDALKELGYQTIITYPCYDPGAEDIIRAITEYCSVPHFRIRKNLGHSLYLGCMSIASCVVGNSSSGLLETPAFKVPCVNIGPRQQGRLRAANVIDVGYEKDAIRNAVQRALTDAQFVESVRSCVNPYGNGTAAVQITDILKKTVPGKVLLQKKMTY